MNTYLNDWLWETAKIITNTYIQGLSAGQERHIRPGFKLCPACEEENLGADVWIPKEKEFCSRHEDEMDETAKDYLREKVSEGR